MAWNQFKGACLILLLLAGGPAAAQSGAPLADATEKDRAHIGALVKQGADVNACQADGMTALHWAVYHDDLPAAALLVNAGANVKAANRYDVTPLSLACANGNTEIVELLLKAGADPNTTRRGSLCAKALATGPFIPPPTVNPYYIHILQLFGFECAECLAKFRRKLFGNRAPV